MIHFSTELLKEAGEKGAEQAARALSTLTNHDVSVRTIGVELLAPDELEQRVLRDIKKSDVMAYNQALSGIPGVAFLVIGRKDALGIVDMLGDKPVGTTKELVELDKSAIKELLNILSNSYINALSTHLNIVVNLSPPVFDEVGKAESVLERITSRKNIVRDHVILFVTELLIAGREAGANFEVNSNLYLLFDKELIELTQQGTR